MTLQEELEKATKKKLKLRINDNHTTMLSVKWEPDCTRVSMHRIFLGAPKNIMDDLACHIRHENSSVTTTIKAFIEDRIKNLDYSTNLAKSKLSTKGEIYDLQKIYDSINNEYFDGALNLHITWFGSPNKTRFRSRVIFGLYHEPLKLIKIHRMMDRHFFPEFFVRYVIYHEMLHNVCPTFYDKKGRHHVHTEDFKFNEKRFKDFERAEVWLKKHHDHFFI